jgi:transposase-like protein
MIGAIEGCLPRTARQRCLAHKVRNLQSKVPEDLWPEFNARAVPLLPGGLAGASVKDSHSSSPCRIPAA